jgi:hypothetical protein
VSEFELKITVIGRDYELICAIFPAKCRLKGELGAGINNYNVRSQDAAIHKEFKTAPAQPCD